MEYNILEAYIYIQTKTVAERENLIIIYSN